MERIGRLRGIKARRIMVVHCPAAVCNYVFKTPFGTHVVLSQNIVAFISAAFALSGKKYHPVKLKVLKICLFAVLYKVPYSESYLHKLIAALVGVVYAVAHAAVLYPPEIRISAVAFAFEL